MFAAAPICIRSSSRRWLEERISAGPPPQKIPGKRKKRTGNDRWLRVFKSTGSRCRVALDLNQERRMTKFAIRLLTLAMYATAMMAVPVLNSAKAAGGDTPSPPADSSSKDKKKKHDKSSSIDDPKFLEGYRTAYTTIYDRHDYTSAIAQL